MISPSPEFEKNYAELISILNEIGIPEEVCRGDTIRVDLLYEYLQTEIDKIDVPFPPDVPIGRIFKIRRALTCVQALIYEYMSSQTPQSEDKRDEDEFDDTNNVEINDFLSDFRII